MCLCLFKFPRKGKTYRGMMSYFRGMFWSERLSYNMPSVNVRPNAFTTIVSPLSPSQTTCARCSKNITANKTGINLIELICKKKIKEDNILTASETINLIFNNCKKIKEENICITKIYQPHQVELKKSTGRTFHCSIQSYEPYKFQETIEEE